MQQMTWRVEPSTLQGSMVVPPSKSHSMRALLFGLLAKGTTHLSHLLSSPDVAAMARVCEQLGAQIEYGDRGSLAITGVGGKIGDAEDVLQAGNSGLLLRLIGGIAGLSTRPMVITGDSSIRYQRPIQPLLEALSQRGVEAYSLRKNGGAPIFIRGPLETGRIDICAGGDSQPISAMLIACAFAPGPSEIFVEEVGEIPWISLTLDWMRRMGIPYTHDGFSHYQLPGYAEIEAFTYRVPADFSSLLYPIAAALITSSELTIYELDFSDAQGDKKVLTYLQEMGASLEVDQSHRLIHVRRGGTLRGIAIDLDMCIDALPLLAVLGCYAEGVTELRGGRSARYKESDRIASTAQELRKMGAVIEEKPDGLVIHHSPLQGASLFAHADHRLALSLAVAGLGVRGGSTLIRGVEYVDKSYPGFCAALQSLGGDISLCN